MLRISRIAIGLPAKLLFHHVRESLGIGFRIAAVTFDGPFNIVMSEVVALQRQPESAYISGTFTSGQFKAVCEIVNTGFDRIFRILDTAGRLIIFCIVVAFGTLHNICAKAAALLLHP